MNPSPTGDCQVCRETFIKMNSMQVVCSLSCARKVGPVARKKERAHTKARREALKTRSDYVKEAQREFNTWVRLRDRGLSCVSCARSTGSKQNAGHFLSTGARPELRFEPLNVHLQCEHCNTYLSGNLIPYRQELLRRIGAEKVEWLEGPHPAAHLSIEDLKALKTKYRLLAKELERKI